MAALRDRRCGLDENLPCCVGNWNTNSCAGPNSDIAATAFSADKSGFTVGAGVERMLAPNWSVRLEYLCRELV
jgi:opacity protein-like surface antigen